MGGPGQHCTFGGRGNLRGEEEPKSVLKFRNRGKVRWGARVTIAALGVKWVHCSFGGRGYLRVEEEPNSVLKFRNRGKVCWGAQVNIAVLGVKGAS